MKATIQTDETVFEMRRHFSQVGHRWRSIIVLWDSPNKLRRRQGAPWHGDIDPEWRVFFDRFNAVATILRHEFGKTTAVHRHGTRSRYRLCACPRSAVRTMIRTDVGEWRLIVNVYRDKGSKADHDRFRRWERVVQGVCELPLVELKKRSAAVTFTVRENEGRRPLP